MGKMVVKRAATTTKKVTTTTTKKATTTSSVKASSSKSSAKVSSSSTSSLVADAACTNSPFTRSCWSDGFSIATDFDQKHPVTGKTVPYTLTITNTTCNPDGASDQPCLLINNQYPGPVIEANWGDTLEITVINNMQDNGTAIHWHGIRQLGSNTEDGVNGITECPIPPGHQRTYTFLCTQFGTSWYHSHYSSQYGMGVIGTILINGPASSNYDIDLGTFPINEWYYQDAWVANSETVINLQTQGPPPNADTILINGTNNNGAGGKYAQVTVTAGKKHRLRLINTSVDNFIRVKLDNHPFTVMTADFIPVDPLPNQDWVLLAIGQRYDVIFTANQTAGSYWFRAEVATDCLSANNGKGRALFTYSGQTVSAPTDDNETPPTNGCTELVTVPYWTQAVPSSGFLSQYSALNLDLTIEQVASNGKNLVVWALNSTSMYVDWGNPTLEYVMSGNTSYPQYYDVIEIPNEGVWTYWVIQALQSANQNPPEAIAAAPPPHPIHLHGHDFFVLGSGSGQFGGTTSGLNFANPPRRDTSTLPSEGWLALAFEANNPGAWLMHCHIAWHISEGLGVQFLEAKSQIAMSSAQTSAFTSQCSAWNTYAKKMAWPQEDSGL